MFDGKERATEGRDGRERPEAQAARPGRTVSAYLGQYLAGRDGPQVADQHLRSFTDPGLGLRPLGCATPADLTLGPDLRLLRQPLQRADEELGARQARARPGWRSDPGITALLVGRDQAPDIPDVPGIEACGELPWHELMACLAQARVAFFPNVLDASPVLLTEALCLDVPVVVNRRILGGWKYVRPDTGRFFTDQDDVTGAVAACLMPGTSPRATGSPPATGPSTPRAGWRRSLTRRRSIGSRPPMTARRRGGRCRSLPRDGRPAVRLRRAARGLPGSAWRRAASGASRRHRPRSTRPRLSHG